MKVSLNTIKQFTQVNLPVDELVKKINQQLGGVEDVIDLRKRYEGAVIAQVVKCEKHPNADKLSVCEIDDGSGQLTQVVCGAPNVREGLTVVWLKPGATVPATFNDPEPFVLEPKELRGVVSNGMLASAKELALGDDHSGIVELTDTDLLPGKTLSIGFSFAETFGLD
ncbi:MAG TPA: phenylalanine--tRNA ligase subunit beta, partial [Candidatus Saccharibacteria bacterium]|nr:phenylalanine--tRNA ligase subunit beta [Candidatus Saccharibacteria bacterium]